MHEISWVGIVFWLGVFGWLSITAWMKFRSDRERQQTLRALVERGEQLDPATLEKLLPKPFDWATAPRKTPEAETRDLVRGLAIGGVITLFVGVGLLIGAQLVAHTDPRALWGMSTGGVIVLCAGLGLVVSAAVVQRLARKPASDSAVGHGPQ